MVFTSGIVDEWSSSLLVGRSQYYSHLLLAVGVGVEPGWPVGGGEGRDTLLSPEASAVRRVSLGLLGGSAPVRGGSVLVGWFLVNWIVDASIFRGDGRPCPFFVGVGWLVLPRIFSATIPLRLLPAFWLVGLGWLLSVLCRVLLCSFC